MATQVRQFVHRNTDEDARRYLAKGINKACVHTKIGRIALEIGCDVKTVTRARDQQSTLGLACAFNLLPVYDHALDELAGSVGFRLARLAPITDADPLVAVTAVVHRLAAARDPRGPGGVIETDRELIEMERVVDEALETLEATKARIIAAKVRLAA